MQLLVDENNVILGYVVVGTMAGAVEYTGIVPEDFEEKFEPRYYMLKDDVIVENPDYVPAKPNVPTGPTGMQTAITAIINEMGDINEKLNALGGN